MKKRLAQEALENKKRERTLIKAKIDFIQLFSRLILLLCTFTFALKLSFFPETFQRTAMGVKANYDYQLTYWAIIFIIYHLMASSLELVYLSQIVSKDPENSKKCTGRLGFLGVVEIGNKLLYLAEVTFFILMNTNFGETVIGVSSLTLMVHQIIILALIYKVSIKGNKTRLKLSLYNPGMLFQVGALVIRPFKEWSFKNTFIPTWIMLALGVLIWVVVLSVNCQQRSGLDKRYRELLFKVQKKEDLTLKNKLHSEGRLF